MWLEQEKTITGSGICHRLKTSNLLTKKFVANQVILSAELGISLLAACAPTQNPPSLSVSSVSTSSDITIRRSAAAPRAQSTIGASLVVNGNNDIPVNSVIDAGEVPQKSRLPIYLKTVKIMLPLALLIPLFGKFKLGPCRHYPLTQLCQKDKTRR